MEVRQLYELYEKKLLKTEKALYKIWLNEKKQTLKKSDKSSKGTIDEKIKSLLSLINNSKFFFSTSSCSGRAILMIETGKKKEKAIQASWHNLISFKELKQKTKEIENKIKSKKQIYPIYFKFDPLILHIFAFKPTHAALIVDLAREIGFKKSGFYWGKRRWPLIEIRGSETISLPLIKKKCLLPDSYLKLLVIETNKKMKQVWKKTKKFEKALKILLKKIEKVNLFLKKNGKRIKKKG